jgi:hypothetical protein
MLPAPSPMNEHGDEGRQGRTEAVGDTVPAAAVHHLVEGNEEEIERLRHQMEAALAEAEEAERRVEAHPGAPLLPLAWNDLDQPAPADSSSDPPRPARTTVVTRRPA